MLTLRRARAYALVVILIFATVYAVGILRRSGLVDGFGHVIGGDLLTPRMAARIVLAVPKDAAEIRSAHVSEVFILRVAGFFGVAC